MRACRRGGKWLACYDKCLGSTPGTKVLARNSTTTVVGASGAGGVSCGGRKVFGHKSAVRTADGMTGCHLLGLGARAPSAGRTGQVWRLQERGSRLTA